MSKIKTIALVPMRHHSQRVSGKNYRLLGTKPLYCHVLDSLLRSKDIDQVVVETDSDTIKRGINDMYQTESRILVIDRPSELSSPSISMNDILISSWQQLKSLFPDMSESTIIFQTHATNPFLKDETISGAIEKFNENNPDTLMSVTRYQKRLWTESGKPINHEMDKLIQTQDLDPVYEENSSFYIFRASNLHKYNNRLGNRIHFYPMNLLESWDIDTEEDFKIAELILKSDVARTKEKPSSIPSGLNKKLLENLEKSLRNDLKDFTPRTPRKSVMISAPYMMPDMPTFTYFFNRLGVKVIKADVEERLSEEDLIKYNGKYDVAICGDDAFTERIINDSGLKGICKWGTGIDSINKDYCDSQGIPVLNTPNAFSVPVSQSIIAAIFGFSRQTFHSNDKMKNSNMWVKYQGYTLEELTIGIVGLGNIGRHVAHGLSAFNTNLLGYDIISRIPEIPNVEKTPDMETLLRKSDIVCLCCTLNLTSYHLINMKNIFQMKPGSYLINMARGPLVEEEALVKGLMSSHLSGAALDVFEVEPLPETSHLRKLPNVIISSHNSNSSPKYWERVHTNTIRNALKILGDSSL